MRESEVSTEVQCFSRGHSAALSLGTGTVAQPQCLSGNHACVPWSLPLSPRPAPQIYCADQSSCCRHKFSLPTPPKLYFWRITHSSLSTYKIIVGDGSRISITSCSFSGAGQSWAPAVCKGKGALPGKVPSVLASCCSFCPYSSHFASTVVVFIHFAAFLSASHVRHPKLKCCKSTCAWRQRKECTLIISIHASDDRRPDAIAVNLPTLSANWALSVDSRHRNTSRWAGPLGISVANKEWGLRRHWDLQGFAHTTPWRIIHGPKLPLIGRP